MAISSIEKAMESIDGSMPLDLVSIDITDAADYLGQITGESVSEDVCMKFSVSFAWENKRIGRDRIWNF